MTSAEESSKIGQITDKAFERARAEEFVDLSTEVVSVIAEELGFGYDSELFKDLEQLFCDELRKAIQVTTINAIDWSAGRPTDYGDLLFA
jgi:hypothetical protein